MYWMPIEKFRKHLVLLKEKIVAAQGRLLNARKERLARDPGRQRTARIAAKAERDTEASIIKATRNSGRANRDGDHLVAGRITMDTKLQSTRLEPVVHLHELSKVRADAERAGSVLGCLNIRTKNGVGVVVMAEEDFAKLISQE